MCEQIDLHCTAAPQYDVKAQMLSIRRRLERNEDAQQLMAVPEGQLFVHSFYGYALINTALDSPQGSAERADACSQLEILLGKIEKLKHQPPFSFSTDIKPSGGIIIAGHANLLRAGYLLLGGRKAEIKRRFDQGSDEISNAFLAGKVPFPECYPGYTWAEDCIFALESLRLHDVLFKSDYSPARNAWLTWMKAHIDSESGMMMTQPDVKTGAVIDGPRGCALSWALAFLPYIDAKLAHEQYTLFRKNWFVHFIGMLGINEWYHGQSHPTDFPTGPVAFGMGEAATGIGIGACRANGDYRSWHLILRALNAIAIPQWTPTGERSFFFGQCMLADALAVWGETARPWDGAPPTPVNYDGDATEPNENSYFIVCAVVALFSAALVAILVRHTIKLFSDCAAVRRGWQPATVIAFGCQFFAAVAFFTTTMFCLPQLLIFMLIADRLEDMALRPRVLAEQHSK